MASPAAGAEKVALRMAALGRRDALPEAVRVAAAQALVAHADMIGVTPGVVVAGYLPIRSEIDPRPLMARCLALGARLAMPVIEARDQPLDFRIWTPDAALVRGPLGIFQPADGAPRLRPDIVLAPLAAFDRRGHRIGYGGGFYDRTLMRLRSEGAVRAIGVAFAGQEVENIPASSHDATLDLVLTESGIIDLRS